MMPQPTVIRTEQQYESYLAEIQALIELAPPIGTPQSDRLELLTILVEAYERTANPVETLDPIDAIEFRMHEKSLRQADLVPYFGTRSRVSEVLARKRPLTVPMIRALSTGLGISAETLIGGMPADQGAKTNEVDWSRFPVKEMVARGWLNKLSGKGEQNVREAVEGFISQVGWGVGNAAFKRSLAGAAYSPTNKYALFAWLSRVVQRARSRNDALPEFDDKKLNAEALKELAQLSWFEEGPKLAIEFLEKHGIAVVIERHLRGTMLDGAALKDSDGRPIIALTLRHDRVDNFWFTVLHEAAHIWKHVVTDETFLDDIEVSSEDRRESEANRLAREAFIPRLIWKRSEAFLNPSTETINDLARELRIAPSIVAGRIRRDTNNYTQFNELLGIGQVSQLLASEFER